VEPAGLSPLPRAPPEPALRRSSRGSCSRPRPTNLTDYGAAFGQTTPPPGDDIEEAAAKAHVEPHALEQLRPRRRGMASISSPCRRPVDQSRAGPAERFHFEPPSPFTSLDHLVGAGRQLQQTRRQHYRHLDGHPTSASSPAGPITTVLAEKRLQLLHDLVPKAELIALLGEPRPAACRCAVRQRRSVLLQQARTPCRARSTTRNPDAL
jgi:hypothetical protein